MLLHPLRAGLPIVLAAMLVAFLAAPAGAQSGGTKIVMGQKCLDAGADSPPLNGTVVQVTECHDVPQQTWNVRPDGTIRGAGGKCLRAGVRRQWDPRAPEMVTALAEDTTDMVQAIFGTGDVILWDCVGVGPSQHWTFTKEGGEVRGLAGKCLTGGVENSLDGAVVYLWDCVGVPQQQWDVGFAAVRRRDDGKCLDLRPNGTEIQIWGCGDLAAHDPTRWRWERWPESPDKSLAWTCLDAVYDNPPDGTEVRLWECKPRGVGGPQRWLRASPYAFHPGEKNLNAVLLSGQTWFDSNYGWDRVGKCMNLQDGHLVLQSCNGLQASSWTPWLGYGWHGDNAWMVIVKDALDQVSQPKECVYGVDANPANGTPVRYGDCSQMKAEMHQEFTPYSDGSIRPLAGRCLTVADGSGQNGTPVVAADCAGEPWPQERWTVNADGTIRNPTGTRCVTVRSGTQDVGLSWCGGGQDAAQRWTVN